VPVAVNCWVVPTARLGLAGVTAIDCKVATVTVRVVVPETLPRVAVMIEVPAATPVARPPVEIVATEEVAEAQVTEAVMALVVPSE